MAFSVRAKGVGNASKRLSGLPKLLDEIAADARKQAIKTGADVAVETTIQHYNISRQNLSPFVSGQDSGKLSGVVLKVRALPLSVFSPVVKMQRFTYVDSIRRHVSRVLPTVSFTRMRGGSLHRLPGAFPLHQRTAGALAGGEKVVRRIGADRNRLTQFRFYTFPRAWLHETLIPAVRDAMGKDLAVRFDAAFRKSNGRLRGGD